MKICPFISHMIGDGRANILQVDTTQSKKSNRSADTAEEVVILGYDGDSSVGVKTKTKSKAKSKAKSRMKKAGTLPSHLLCLKEPCRFYQADSGACMFDSIFDMVDKQAKAEPKKDDGKATEKVATKVTNELEKFWKFQTKSVTELISSIGDTEKKQQDSLTQFQKGLDKTLAQLSPQDSSNEFKRISDDIGQLNESVNSREEGIESFTTTISELVMNIDDSILNMRQTTDTLSERIEKLELSIPSSDDLHKRIEDTLVQQLDKLSTLWGPANEARQLAGGSLRTEIH